MKRNDTRPARRFTLTTNGVPRDTTPFSAAHLFMKSGSDPVVDVTLTFVTPRSGGQVDATFADADVDVSAVYQCEIECKHAAGGRETFPNKEGTAPQFFTLTLVDDLANIP